MMSQHGNQTIVIHVLPNILRNKDNQATKLGQLREYSMKNIFLEKPYTKCDEETSPRTFSEKQKLRIPESTVEIFIRFVLLHLLVDDYHNVLKLSY